MNRAERARRIERFLDQHCFAVLRDKGEEYSRGEEDVNSNFKRGAETINSDPLAVAYVYLSKHLDSIAHYVKTRTTPSDEPIEGRIGDAVNYLLIIATMLETDELPAKSPADQFADHVLEERQRVTAEAKERADTVAFSGLGGYKPVLEEPQAFTEYDGRDC